MIFLYFCEIFLVRLSFFFVERVEFVVLSLLYSFHTIFFSAFCEYLNLFRLYKKLALVMCYVILFLSGLQKDVKRLEAEIKRLEAQVPYTLFFFT